MILDPFPTSNQTHTQSELIYTKNRLEAVERLLLETERERNLLETENKENKKELEEILECKDDTQRLNRMSDAWRKKLASYRKQFAGLQKQINQQTDTLERLKENEKTIRTMCDKHLQTITDVVINAFKKMELRSGFITFLIGVIAGFLTTLFGTWLYNHFTHA